MTIELDAYLNSKNEWFEKYSWRLNFQSVAFLVIANLAFVLLNDPLKKCSRLIGEWNLTVLISN